MNIDFKKLTKPYEHQLIKSIKYLCSIDSVYDENTVSENTPYGIKVDNALKEFAKLGDMYGFDVERNPRFTELSIGESGPLIEIFGHLDVVPVSNDGINHFDIKEEGDNLIGRGSADDKGPLLAAFYALKALKDNGYIRNTRVKIFAGGDEERGSSCLKYYVNELKKEAPTFGFTPDSAFPLVYGEKGTANVCFSKEIKLNHIKSIYAGTAFNIVIQYCDFEVDNIDEIKDKLDKSKIEKIEGNKITFKGKAAHGSAPQKGESAFLIGLKELSKVYEDKLLTDLYDNFIDYTGKVMGIYSNSEHLKNTVMNIGKVRYKDNKFTLLGVNIRYPETTNINKIAEIISSKIGFKVDNIKGDAPLLIDPKSKLVTLLLNAYNEEMNTNDLPFTSGGGTYAKEVKNTVAFGMEFKGKNYKMHEDGEYVSKSDLFITMSIYAHAIYNLINSTNEN